MVDEKLKKKASSLVKKAKEKGLIKAYNEFCETQEADDNTLSEEEIIYYTSKYGGSK